MERYFSRSNCSCSQSSCRGSTTAPYSCFGNEMNPIRYPVFSLHNTPSFYAKPESAVIPPGYGIPPGHPVFVNPTAYNWVTHTPPQVFLRERPEELGLNRPSNETGKSELNLVILLGFCICCVDNGLTRVQLLL